MQYSSIDGMENKIIKFDKVQVSQYKQLFDLTYYRDEEVPPLYCAKLWGQFELFRQFRQSTIKLVRTTINQVNKLEVGKDYCGQMTMLSCKTFKRYKRYEFLLEINKNNAKCISIKQIFIERIENDTNN